MGFQSLKEITEIAYKEQIKIWEVICNEDAIEQGYSKEESFSRMREMYKAMKHADETYDAKLVSKSNMAGGDGEKIHIYRNNSSHLLGDFLLRVMEKAVKMGESNACMKRIVAAPTAGSCGVIPAVLISYEEEKNVPEDEMVKALFVAGGIGEVIATVASISGAEGGCQAEIGSASAMAAGAITFLEGGDNKQIMNAIALSLKNMLGLTCDPVGGLVEVPCIKRNASGAVNAVIASQMALAGIESRIPVDEVIDSMGRIGKKIPTCLKETGQEGLAITPTALKIYNRDV